MATVDEQLTEINTTQFFDDVRTKLQQINKFFSDNSLSLEGSLLLEVNGIKVKMTPQSQGAVNVEAGDSSGEALYTWRVPMGWVI